jgi:hypothetical protein
MRFRLRRWALVFVLAAVAPPAVPEVQAPVPESAAQREADIKLPNGKSQREEILKLDHEQNLKDAAQLVDLAQQLKEELEKNTHDVLSLATLKKTDDIEKLAKKIRSRMRRN